MKRRFKRILSVLLVVVMIVGSAPLSGFAGLVLPNWADLFTLKADAAAYSGKCGDNLTWSLDTDTGVLTISGTGDMYDWYNGSYAPWYSNRSSIKTAVIGNSVTGIGVYAFYDCTGLTSVTIPDSVTSIGDWAFYSTGVYNDSSNWENNVLYIGNHLIKAKTGIFDDYLVKLGTKTIADYAFNDCAGLTSVTIPDSVTSIGELAFWRCTGLTSVTIPDSVTSIGESAFYYCTGLTSVAIPDSVTRIGANAFYSTGVYNDSSNWENEVLYIGNHLIKATTSISGDYLVKSGTKTIAGRAFSGCTGLTSVTIPDSVTSIGGSAFNNCNNIYLLFYKNSFAEQYAIDNSLNYLIISKIPDDTETLSGKVTNSFLWSIDKMTETLTLDCNGTMVSFENDVAPWIQYEEYIKHIVINDGCTNISKNAFMLCSKVESVLIPNSVTNINSYAFYGCSRLTGINIPVGVTSIGDYAFYGCTGLTSVTIPDSVTSIGGYSFSGCIGLTSVTIPDSLTSIGSYVFYGCTGIKELTMPCSAKIYKNGNTFYNCRNIEKVTLTKGTGKMQDYGTTDYSYTPWYESRGKIKEIVIEDGVQNIGSYAFYGCTGLTSVTIGNSVTSIGERAFSYCRDLTSVTIGNSVTSIGWCAFEYCTGLTSVTIPDSVTSIDGYAFKDCTGLTSVTIGNSVTSIGNYAFYGCTGLTSVTIPDSVTSIGDSAFNGCTGLEEMVIPYSVKRIGTAAFTGCTGLTSITIPDSVTSIGDSAFNGCTGLEEMVIPYSVKRIGTAAFTGCTNLGSLTVYSRNCTFADDATAYYTTIYGFTGSTAETYANEKGFDFVAIDDTHTHIYDNDCDSICNLCEAERTVGEHIFGDYTVTKEPTCTEQGEKTRTCSVCGYSETTEVPATGHTLGEYNITKEPTCTEQGEKTRTCSVCGYSETTEVPATGHTYDSDCDTDCNACGAIRVPPHTDKDNDGVCDNCGAYLSDIALSTVKNVAVSAGETVYLKFTAPYTGRYTFYSSSSSDTYGYICDSNKNSLASDDDSGSNNNFLITTTLTQGTVYYLGVKYYNSSNSGTIPVTINYICDHTSTHTEHKDSTCNEHGYDKVICDICGATISTTELPFKHDYVATVTDPTCTEQGYTTYTCSLCGDSYTADYTEPLNHPHKTWRVTKNPTATSTGLMTETCDLCGAKTVEMEIPMLIPNFVTGITVSPNRLALNVGETANLTAVITPDTAENKNVIWSSSDTDIATVADGVVTAKTPGVAIIIVQSEDGGYKDFCVVRVVSLTPANGAVVDNENGLIYGISSNSAGINSYVNTVDDTMTVECDSALLGTGSVVNIVKDGTIVDSYKVVIFGDVDGDGWYDGQDAITVSCLANGMLTREQVGEAVWMAADCNHDGVIDQLDVDLLNQAGVLLSSVDQTKPTEELLETSAEYNEYLSLIDQMGGDDTPETPKQDGNDSFFTRIIALIESIIKILNTFFTKII